MFSHLIAALFAVLFLSVSSRPLRSCSGHSHSGASCSETTSLAALPSSSAAPTPSTTSSPAASPVPTSVSDTSNGPFTDGVATYFYQNGNPGACGQVNSDSALICAMDQARFGTSGPASPLCGQKVQITNQSNGKTVTVTIADDCPTCENADSIDLSVSAFEQLDDLSVGVFPISWVFVS